MKINLNDIPRGLLGPAPRLDTSDLTATELTDMEHQRELYNVQNLDEKQKSVVDYVLNNTGSMVLIQAPPGTGKTFTLMTLAYTSTKPVIAVVYKHDLLYTFRYNATRMTVAKFLMGTFGIRNLRNYQMLEKQVTTAMSSKEFCYILMALMHRAQLPPLTNGIVILDEYTMIPKLFLIVILAKFRLHGITTVLCGDRNQLQSIHNATKHTTCTSYDIVQSFADQVFELTTNHRCADNSYNKFIEYVSAFSCEQRLNDFAFALISTLFMPQLIQAPTFEHLTHISLANTHRELANDRHNAVWTNAVQVSYYMLDVSNVRNMDMVFGRRTASGLYVPAMVDEYLEMLQHHQTDVRDNKVYYDAFKPNLEKFLPFIPLIIGARYFVFKFSEHSQAILTNIEVDGSNVPSRITLRHCTTQEYFTVVRECNNEVLFDEHLRYLRADYKPNRVRTLDMGAGRIYNFPIYPAFMMSLYMCQGRTITEPIHIQLSSETRYQALYVAFSRVKHPSQIARITIPHQMQYLLSNIINFPEFCVQNFCPTIELIDTRLNNNYIVYCIPSAEIYMYLSQRVIQFIQSKSTDERTHLRNELVAYIPLLTTRIMEPFNADNEVRLQVSRSNLLLQNINLFLALSTLDEMDARIWLDVYTQFDADIGILADSTCDNSSKTDDWFMMKFTNMTTKRDSDPLKCIIAMAKVDTVNDFTYGIDVQDGIGRLKTTRLQQRIYNALCDGTGVINQTCMESWLYDALKESPHSQGYTLIPAKRRKFTTHRTTNELETNDMGTLENTTQSVDASKSMQMLRSRRSKLV